MGSSSGKGSPVFMMDPLFKERMQSYIPDEMEAFEASLQQPLFQGLRMNPKKTTLAELQEALPFLKNPSPFAKDAWYIQGSYGLHPWHVQGRFYLQEPSAGSAVSAMEIQPGDVVLDLCAAPGSKSTQILGNLQNGFLVSNEIDAKRAQVLLSNMERMGAENFMVTSMDSQSLCSQLPEGFDKILVDAPCSGEGMMKKHDLARNDWSLENIQLCAARQKEILGNAWQALKPGGELVYSTCTYAREENEDIVAWFLAAFPDMEQLPVSLQAGRPGLATPGMDASLVRRIFPMDQGEGHFVARFRKGGSSVARQPNSQDQDGLSVRGESTDFASLKEKRKEKKGKGKKKGKGAFPGRESLNEAVAAFMEEQLPEGFPYYHMEAGHQKVQVYGMYRPFWELKGKVLRQGVYIGDLIKNRFEPAHAFFMSTSMLKGKQKTEVTLEQMDAFVHGMQLDLPAPRGWRALSWQGVPFGFGKSDGRRITNKYPKGLRLLPDSHLRQETPLTESSKTETTDA